MPSTAPKARIVLLLALAALGARPVAAATASAGALLKDCQDEKIDGKYSQKDYAAALRNIPTDSLEYTNCEDVIRQAQLASAGGSKANGGGGGAAGGGGGVGGGGTAPSAGTPASPATQGTENVGKSSEQVLAAASPAERKRIASATMGSAAVQVGGRNVSPAISGLSPAGAANVVPTPLAAALILLAVGLAATGAQLLRSRVLARREPAS